MSKDKKIYYILYGASLLLGFLASKYAERDAQRELEAKVNNSIIQACVQVGILEVEQEK